jgi:hypothetical protein
MAQPAPTPPGPATTRTPSAQRAGGWPELDRAGAAGATATPAARVRGCQESRHRRTAVVLPSMCQQPVCGLDDCGVVLLIS